MRSMTTLLVRLALIVAALLAFTTPALAAAPSKHLTFLATDDGKPFEAMAFTKWFRRSCDAAGLSGCSAHGLRKAACRRLAMGRVAEEDALHAPVNDDPLGAPVVCAVHTSILRRGADGVKGRGPRSAARDRP